MHNESGLARPDPAKSRPITVIVCLVATCGSCRTCASGAACDGSPNCECNEACLWAKTTTKANGDDQILLGLVSRKLRIIKIVILVLAVLGRFLAKLGPGTLFNGSGSKNGVEHTSNQIRN